MPNAKMLDTSLHARRRAARMRDPEYRAAYERSAREVAQTDQVIRSLDTLRSELGISKAELARQIDRNASSIRRLFSAKSARPELPLVAAIADALGAEVRAVPTTHGARSAAGVPTGPKAPATRVPAKAQTGPPPGRPKPTESRKSVAA